MGLTSGRAATSNSLISKSNSLSQKKVGVVYDVILDSSHPFAIKKRVGSLYTGCVVYRSIDNLVSSEGELPIAWPIDKNFKSLPVKNELVEIYEISSGVFGYRRMYNTVNPSNSNPANTIRNGLTPTSDGAENVRNYQETFDTGITNTNFDDSVRFDGYGNYYFPITGLHKLRLYEGNINYF